MDDSTKDVQLNYDWIDTILVPVGFSLAVLGGVALARAGLELHNRSYGLYAAVSFAPVVLRRVVFGAPVLPPPRRGGMASLTSIVGLFASLIGAGFLAVGGIFIVGSFAAPPDFVAEQRKIAAGPSLDVSVHVVGEDPAVTARREADVAAAHEAFLLDSAARERAAFVRDARASLPFGMKLCGIGIVLLALGAFAAWYRCTGSAAD